VKPGKLCLRGPLGTVKCLKALYAKKVRVARTYVIKIILLFSIMNVNIYARWRRHMMAMIIFRAVMVMLMVISMLYTASHKECNPY
jgi:hypothetical protein